MVPWAATLSQDGAAGVEDRRGGAAVQIRSREATLGPGLHIMNVFTNVFYAHAMYFANTLLLLKY